TLGIDSSNVLLMKDARRVDMDEVFGTAKNHKGRLWRLIEEGQTDLYVFYSGHGVPGGQGSNSAYLLPVDSRPNQADLSAYPLSQLLDNLGKLPTRSTTVFLDACFLGQSPDAADPAPLIKNASPVIVLPKIAVGDPGKITLFAAAGETQFASWD